MLCISRKLYICLYISIVSLMAVACGGGGGGTVAGGGIGGTGITSGTVTGFGSVYVNGVEYFLENTRLDIDDDLYEEAVSEDYNLENVLDIDMVVTLAWEKNADGSFTASSIEFDEDVEGPVSSGSLTNEDQSTQTRSFVVLGVDVIVNRYSTSFVGWTDNGFETIAEGEVVEVSGFFDENGVLLATRVEREDDFQQGTEIEIKGVVEAYTSGAAEFSLGDITVTIGSVILPQDFANGKTVEVHGVVTELAPDITISATEIETEDEGLGDTGDTTVSLEGIVTSYTSNSSFEVSGQAVNAADALFEPASLEVMLSVGDRVEVEGPVSGGVLMASAVEARGDEIRVNAVATEGTSQDQGRIELAVAGGQLLTVRENAETEFEDERDGISGFGIADINPGDYLQIEAIIDSSDELIANQVVRDEPDAIELQGPVDILGTGGDSIGGDLTILGITVRTDGSTEFEDENEVRISGTEFFARVQDGDLARFSDEWPADGLAEKVRFEN